MWRIIIAAVSIIFILGMLYLVTRFHRFPGIWKLGRTHRILSWAAAFGCASLAGVFALINLPTMIVVYLYLIAAFLVSDLIGLIVRIIYRKMTGQGSVEKSDKGSQIRSCRGSGREPGQEAGFMIQYTAAILFTVVYLAIGWYNAHHVSVTEYAFHTDKPLSENLRIAMFADSHLGITLNGESFAREMERLQKTDPDVVLIVGDFVDDDSSKKDMEEACRALGALKTRYGVYFVYGNHDNGYYRYRDFDSQELRSALTENGVTILEDETVLIHDEFYLIGRRDRSMRSRMDASALTADIDKAKYSIMLDHQPNDYAGEAASGADLVLSGHTHGGHIFPAGLIGLLTGANDRVYGTEVRDGTTFLVTSGISGWAIPFKTGTFSEFVVIDIRTDAGP